MNISNNVLWGCFLEKVLTLNRSYIIIIIQCNIHICITHSILKYILSVKIIAYNQVKNCWSNQENYRKYNIGTW